MKKYLVVKIIVVLVVVASIAFWHYVMPPYLDYIEYNTFRKSVTEKKVMIVYDNAKFDEQLKKREKNDYPGALDDLELIRLKTYGFRPSLEGILDSMVYEMAPYTWGQQEKNSAEMIRGNMKNRCNFQEKHQVFVRRNSKGEIDRLLFPALSNDAFEHWIEDGHLMQQAWK